MQRLATRTAKTVTRAFGALITALVIGWSVYSPPEFDLLGRGREMAIDLNAQLFPYERWEQSKAESMVFVAIDEASIQEVGQWPWDRGELARLLEHLGQSGVKAIGVDVLFLERDQRSASELCRRLAIQYPFCEDPKLNGDRRLADAAKSTPTVISFALGRDQASEQAHELPTAVITTGQTEHQVPLTSSLHAPISELRQALGLGFVNAYVEDGVVRRVPLFLRHGTTTYPSLSIEMLRLASGSDQIVLRSSANGGKMLADFGAAQLSAGPSDGFILHHGHTSRFQKVSASRLIKSPLAELQGKVVIVGLDAIAIGDRHSTALEEAVAGPLLQLQVIDQLLSGRILSTHERIDQLALAIIWAAVLLLVLRSKSISSRTLSLISICGAGLILGLCLSSFLIQGFVVAYPIHLLVWVVGSALAYFYKAYSEEKLRRRVQGSFAQYISPEVVKRIAQSKQMPALGGERIQATVVFIDVRGFTGLTEHLKDEPELLVSVVSEVMSEITSHLIQEGATIDKYIGDCVMAFWNAPERQQDHLLKAMRATIGLVRDSDRIAAKVRQMNSRLTAIPIQFGVGLSTGEVIVGNLGSHFRFNYSVLGDVVNLASRLESLTKEMQEPILVAGVDSVSLSLLAANDIYLESKGLVEIRGRQSRVEVFRPNLEYRPTEA